MIKLSIEVYAARYMTIPQGLVEDLLAEGLDVDKELKELIQVEYDVYLKNFES